MDTSLQTRSRIGKQIVRARTERQLKQTELAELAGVGIRTLRRLEHGGPSSLDSFLQVMCALGLQSSVVPQYVDGVSGSVDLINDESSALQLSQAFETSLAPVATESRSSAAKSGWGWGNDDDD